MMYVVHTPKNSRQIQAAETRRKILQQAKILFFREGYHKTTVRSIHRALNMADGILYHYFPGGKRELLTVLIQEGFEEQLGKLNSSNSDLESLPLKEALKKIYELGNELFTGDIELMRILFRESDVMELSETIHLSNLLHERLQWFAGFLQRRYEKGEVRKMNFEIAARQFMSMSIQDIVSKLINIELLSDLSRDITREQIIDHMLDLWNPLTS
ncbi:MULTISPECIES: TetR/AcrR family transcriptional regulator [Paenibacillus]|jgi:AcrR family transcriptional regulator|uniref:TetR/AcrR family transcriptional regulator n=1 Tax=Paenibacillus TaxID=44249 RepID=UPI000FB2CD4B|nr:MULTISPECIES: TetR/AcrR family transcriptional regulator [Paenibacillus]MCP3743115.1 TetR/AcrR family transcriptional regulator [Paenibacillus sp. A3M_27_13]MCP3793705.1 TetR/AcrR family transcriptional regulator [Paenibacillus sp. CH40]MDY8046488.1 TetR/AcrR family transcriptional regulator [Paenibacillus polymyxa]